MQGYGCISMQAVTLSEVLGARLVDFDITRPLSEDEQAQLRRIFQEHHLLLVRGQDVTEEDQNRFVRSFGPIHRSQATGGLAAYVTNGDQRVVGVGTTELLWHNDGTYGAHPGIATSLWAEDVEPGAAPTWFTNAVRVLDNLPAELRRRIEPLQALHMKDTKVERTNRRWREVEIELDAEPGRYASYVHPIVYQPPHLDVQTILVNELQTSHVVDLPKDEGEAVLQELFSRLYDRAVVYSHEWQPNDVIIWDNLALQHCRPTEMGAPRRHLRRQSLDGWFTDDGLIEWDDTVVYDKAIVAENAKG
jgi:taurine dioxygenase